MCDVRSVKRKRCLTPFFGLLVLVVLPGCQDEFRVSPQGLMRDGRYAEARDLVETQIEDDREERRYMLSRMRAGVLNLDAGDPERAERWFAEVYDVLRTQGLNKDKTVSSVVLTEGVKVWKGEPFEQALALVYYGFVQASLGSWDNARAAAGNALFYLRDFDAEAEGEPERMIDSAEIARRASRHEAEQGGGEYGSGDEYLDKGYVAEENNFTMAYLLHGIASHQLGRDDEASDYLHRAEKLEPALGPMVERIKAGGYNTVVVIADGMGPMKIAMGPGNALSRFSPLERAASPGTLRYAGRTDDLPAVTDVNRLAVDHRWNNLEDVRLAKNVIGKVGQVGGTFALARAASEGNGTLALIGAGVLLAGTAIKSTAQANTDYCDVFPQRLFLAVLDVEEPGQELVVDLTGPQGPRSASVGPLAPPRTGEAAFYYLRAPVERQLNANANAPQPTTNQPTHAPGLSTP